VHEQGRVAQELDVGRPERAQRRERADPQQCDQRAEGEREQQRPDRQPEGDPQAGQQQGDVLGARP
jgi:hypothetical protein